MMSSELRLTSIFAEWSAYTPSNISALAQSSEGTEVLISWSAENNDENKQESLGFKPIPISSFTVFNSTQPKSVGVLTHYNRVTIDSIVPTSFTLTLTMSFQDLGVCVVNVPIAFTEGAGAADDTIGFTVSTPYPTTYGQFNVTINGYDIGGTLVSSFVSPEGAVKKANLLLTIGHTEVVDDLGPGLDYGECPVTFEPVFAPAGCTVDPVCPIPDDPIIQRCYIPEAPEPVVDCPAIDLPVAIFSPAAAAGPAGPAGPPGPPGSDGADGVDGIDGSNGTDGCSPKITFSATMVSITDCGGARVEKLEIPYGTCNKHIHMTVYVCAYTPVADECCTYLCCDGSWRVYSGDERCRLAGDSMTTADPADPTPIGPPAEACSTGNSGYVQTKCSCDPKDDCLCTACDPSVLQPDMPFTVTVGDSSYAGTMEGLTGVIDSTNLDCDFDSIKLECSVGTWIMSLRCTGGDYVSTTATPHTVGSVTTFTATFNESAFDCCVGSGSIAATMTSDSSKCNELACVTTSTTEAPTTTSAPTTTAAPTTTSAPTTTQDAACPGTCTLTWVAPGMWQETANNCEAGVGFPTPICLCGTYGSAGSFYGQTVIVICGEDTGGGGGPM